MFGKNNTPSPTLMNQNEYFLSVYIGFASSQYFINPIIALNTNIRNAQISGVLEHITAVGISVRTFVMIHAIEDFLRTTLFVILYVIGGRIVFGLDVTTFNFPILLIFFLLIVPLYYCIAVIVAGLTLFLKETGRINFLVRNYITLFSGIFFSVKLLPFPIDRIKDIIPLYRSVDVARMIFAAKVNYTELFYNIKIILIYFLVYLFISIVLMRKVAESVKRDGAAISH
jgi:ABC-type polysaccharide/polyol phosphate export permease